MRHSAGLLDRITPTQRPAGRAAGTQKWRELLFLHWSFPLDVVRPLVPAALEIDPWDGRAWIGLVPFAMREIRSSWMPRWPSFNFLETNVRTYVHQRGEPGVYFFSLEASSWLAVKVARAVWQLPYFHASMRATQDAGVIAYESMRRGDGPFMRARWRVGPAIGASRVGTLEHFLLERYVLFSLGRSGRVRRGQVHHVPYPAQHATLESLEQTLVSAAGLPLDPTTPPETVHYAEGVDVEVFGPWDAPEG